MVNVPTDTELRIEFSEKMGKSVVENSIYIFPELEQELKWKKNRLLVKPKQPLKNNQTYILTVGAQASDLQGNKLGDSYSLAFSTGASIDSGEISGSVYVNGKPQAGLAVWAYNLSENDSVLPWKRPPDYGTQSGTTGQFELDFLASAVYRIIAVDDLNRNLLWDPPREPLGLTFADVQVGGGSKETVEMLIRTVSRDTAGFGLVDCVALDSKNVILNFNRELAEIRSNKPQDFKIVTQTGDTLNPTNIYQVYGQGKSIYLRTEGLKPNQSVDILVTSISAKDAQPLDFSQNHCQFITKSQVDIAKPTLKLHSPKRNQKGLELDTEIKLYFSEMMNPELEGTRVILEDSSGTQVQTQVSWNSPTELGIDPVRQLAPNMSYNFDITTGRLFDMSGNGLIDSTLNFSFETLDSGQLGSLSGSVMFKKEKFLGNIQLQLKSLDYGQTYGLTLSGPGEFEFKNLLPGQYSLEGWVDFDNNGIYSSGNLNPFTPAEPFAVDSDTILIRPRWGTEGVILRF
ncbi:MAG: Ig-like domain-containing protein [candidate division Zixibacteria bacterium]|nr:Ig-like domain-containing protein [candidate division Zixibacteria bacterium]